MVFGKPRTKFVKIALSIKKSSRTIAYILDFGTGFSIAPISKLELKKKVEWSNLSLILGNGEQKFPTESGFQLKTKMQIFFRHENFTLLKLLLKIDILLYYFQIFFKLCL